MADNYYKNDNIIYGMEINEDTVWSSHDEKGNLISQVHKRITSYVDNPIGGSQIPIYTYWYDIPCYPTGLFLHLSFQSIFSSINYKINYYPYTGEVRVYNEDNIEVTISGTYHWGSCVPKTYCSHSKTIFGYHNFKQTQLYGDLAKKWYSSNKEGVIISKFKSKISSKHSETKYMTATMPARKSTVTVFIPLSLSADSEQENPEVYVTNIQPGVYNVSSYEYNKTLNHIRITFNTDKAQVDDQDFTFTVEIKYYISDEPIQELANIPVLFFMDPNLWSFIERKVNQDQTDDDIARYPLYKGPDFSDDDSKENFHSNRYFQNSKILKGTYFFLYQTGKNYILTDNNQSYNSFDYGYMSNTIQANPSFTIKKTPVGNRQTSLLESDGNDKTYFKKTYSAASSYEIARYGVGGTSVKTMIENSPYVNMNLLREKEKNLYLIQKSPYSIDYPCILASNWGFKKNENIWKEFTTELDQFHFMANDQIYRVPLNWHIEWCRFSCVITKLNFGGAFDFKKYYVYASPIVEVNGKDDEEGLKKKCYIDLVLENNTSCTTGTIRGKNAPQKPVDEIEYCFTVTTALNKEARSGLNNSSSNPSYGAPYYNIFRTYNIKLPTKGIKQITPFPFRTNSKYQGTTAVNIGECLCTWNTDIYNMIYFNENISSAQQQIAFYFSGIAEYVSSHGSDREDYQNYEPVEGYSFAAFGFANAGYSVNLIEYILTGIDPNDDQYECALTINNTKVSRQYTENKTTKTTSRSLMSRSSWKDFEISKCTKPIFFNSYLNDASYNGIPLVPFLLKNAGGGGEKKFLDKTYAFSRQHIGATRLNFGFDSHAQFFNQDVYPEEYVVCYAFPDKPLIEKTKTFNYTYNSNGIIPIEIDTGFTTNDPVYDLTALTGTSWPQFEGSVELVYDKYIIKGNLVFYGGGPSRGTATITLKYKTYE